MSKGKRPGKNHKKEKNIRSLVALLVFLVLALVIVNYPFIDRTITNFLETSATVHIDRIIDGDTIETQFDGETTSVRLLGINAPETKEPGYEEAKDFLNKEILGQNVTLEFVGDRYDKYNRLLAYVFLDNTNINIQMVSKGFANYYFYDGKDKYSNDLEQAWQECLLNQINLCEVSTNICSLCININSKSIINSCSQTCDITNWTIKGEGREKFIFSQQTLQPQESTGFVLNLANTGGSLYLRDDQGKLVEFEEG